MRASRRLTECQLRNIIQLEVCIDVQKAKSSMDGVEKAAFCGVVFLLGAVLIVQSSVTIDPDVAPRFVLLAGVVTLLLLAFLLALGRRGSPVDPAWLRSPVVLFWLLYLVAVGISTIVATNRSEALYQWQRSIVFFFLFVSLIWLLSRVPERIETLAVVISLIALALGIAGIVELGRVIHESGLDLAGTYRVHGASAHRNLFSQTLLLTAPFAAFGAIVGRGLWRRLCMLGLVLSVGLMTLLMTRSVWLGAVGAGVATVVLLVSAGRRAGATVPAPRQTAAGVVLALSIVAGSILLCSQWGAVSAFSSRLQSVTLPHEGSMVPRVFLWERTARMVRDHPFLGVGAGNWQIVFPRYAGGSELTRDVWRSPKRPHNDFLWVLAETGIAGLTPYVAVVLILLVWSARVVWFAPDLRTRALGASLFFAQVGYLLFSLFSFPGERIEHSVLIVTIYAMTFTLYRQARPAGAKLPRPAALGLAAAGLVVVMTALPVGIVRMESEIHVRRAYAYLRAKQYGSVVAEIDRAYSRESTLDRSAFPLLFYRGVALAKLGEETRAYEDLVQARRDSPYKVVVLNSLALSSLARGDVAGAEKLWRLALRIQPGYAPALVNLARLRVNTGRDGRALRLLRPNNPPAGKPELSGGNMSRLRPGNSDGHGMGCGRWRGRRGGRGSCRQIRSAGRGLPWPSSRPVSRHSRWAGASGTPIFWSVSFIRSWSRATNHTTSSAPSCWHSPKSHRR
ncbi:MAG: hypothetical protein GXP47_03700 [Acidobacteria bacterium]|nr:hypothetical protein [Acidobacteriota bacterium]